MSDSSSTPASSTRPETGRTFADLSREEMQSALFAQMVMQQANLAMMLLGRTPHPETGKTLRDLDAAKLFIDQIEMLEIKTKGNLNPQESGLLKQSLTTLRLAFVEAVNKPAKPPEPTIAEKPTSPAPENKTAATDVPNAPGDEDSKKRFSKKYSD